MDDQHADRRSGLSAAPDPIQTDLPRTPYPGLRPFEPEEWMIFFGREVMIADVIERLARQHLVFIHGASGSGKSSLVRAGVLPKLARQQSRQGRSWTPAIMRPSGGPLWNLAGELARLEGRQGDVDRIGQILRLFNRRDASLARIVAGLDRLAGADICLLIDQFEELFRFEAETSREEAELFIALLIDLIPGDGDDAADPDDAEAVPPPETNLYVVITMRSEFLGECARFDRFAEAINRAQYLVPRLTRASLTRSIRYPARNYGGAVTPELADRLIMEVRGKPDELPLIQHGLMVLWNQAAKSRADGKILIDRPMIDTLGGLTKCLSAHAEEVLGGAAPDEARLRGAERMFRALTDTNAEGQAIRRQCEFAALKAVAGIPEADLRAIIDAFRADSVCFLTPYPPSPIKDRTIIDISHEALIRCWQRLRDWVKKEAAAAEKYLELERRANQWDRGRHELLAGDELREYLAWWDAELPSAPWAARHGKDFELVRKFLAASQAEEKGRERRQKRRMMTWAAAAVFAIAAIGYGSFSWHEKLAADAAAARLEQARDLQNALLQEDANVRSAWGAAFSAETANPPNYESAMNDLREASQNWPDPGAIYAQVEIGRLTACINSSDIRDPGQCQQESLQGLQPDEADAPALFQRVYLFLQNPKWSAAQKKAWGITDATQQRLASLAEESAYLAGMVYYDKGDAADALAWLKLARKASWNDPRTNVSQANAYYLAGLAEEKTGGIAAEEAAMALLQQASDQGFFKADTAIGDLDAKANRQAQADGYYAAALHAGLATQEGSIAAAYHLGFDCLNKSHSGCDKVATEDLNIADTNQPLDYHFAMFMFRLALAIYQNPPAGGAVPSDLRYKADAEYQIANLLYDNPDFKPDHVQALAFLRQAISDKTDYLGDAFLKGGLIYGIGGDGVRKDSGLAADFFNAAIQAAASEVAADPKDGAALDGLSRAYLLSGAWQNALNAANSAIAQAPSDIAYQKEKAMALTMLGRNDEATRIFLKNQNLSDDGNGISWRQDVLADFDTLQKLGFQTPLLAELRKDFSA